MKLIEDKEYTVTEIVRGKLITRPYTGKTDRFYIHDLIHIGLLEARNASISTSPNGRRYLISGKAIKAFNQRLK